MNNIPLEVLEVVLHKIAEYTYPDTERFKTLTPASKQGILSARTVWGAYRYQEPLRQLFIDAIQETPFMFAGAETDQASIAKLETLSKSELATSITLLTLSPRVESPSAHSQMWQQIFREILNRFCSLKHIRFYTLKPEHVNEACAIYMEKRLSSTRMAASSTDVGRAARSRYRARPCFNTLEDYFASRNLESFTVPLRGNSASFYAVPWDLLSFNTDFSASLRRLSINLNIPNYRDPVFGAWIYGCRSLEYLDGPRTRMRTG